MPVVVGLRDTSVPNEDGAYQEVVDILESTLEEARTGQIVAIGLVVIRPNKEIGAIARNPAGCRHFLIAGCEYLKNDIIRYESID